MTNQRNPDGNSILQALLDLSDRGMDTMRVSELITRISTDAKLRRDLQAVWNAHAYPEKAMVYTQITIDQHLFTLTNPAYKLITMLGMYCHQSGLIQVKIEDMGKAIGIGQTSAKQAKAELIECGALTVAVPSVRHEPAIFRVNPALINKGRRKKSDAADFAASLTIAPEDYILNRKIALLAQTNTIHTNEFAYNRLYMITPEEAAAKTVKSRPSKKKRSKASDPMPGQMTFEDFPELMANE